MSDILYDLKFILPLDALHCFLLFLWADFLLFQRNLWVWQLSFLLFGSLSIIQAGAVCGLPLYDSFPTLVCLGRHN